MPHSAKIELNFCNEFQDTQSDQSDDDLAKIRTEFSNGLNNGFNNGNDFSQLLFEETEFIGRETFHDKSAAGYKRESEHR